jgi:hypothetical protein
LAIYLFFPWRSSVLGHLAGQSVEELDQILTVLSGKVERLDVLIEIWIGVAASGVKVYYVIECLKAAVMHVRCAKPDIA